MDIHTAITHRVWLWVPVSARTLLARRIALLVVATPAAFTLLGVLLYLPDWAWAKGQGRAGGRASRRVEHPAGYGVERGLEELAGTLRKKTYRVLFENSANVSASELGRVPAGGNFGEN